MSVALMPYFKALAASEDPKKEILKWVGVTKKEKLLGDRVAVAIYGRPEKTEGGLYVTDTEIRESQYQGPVGLLIALGTTAFKYDGSYEFEGDKPKIGDWVLFRPSDGYQFAFRKACIRVFKSDAIMAVVSSPLLYY